MHRRLALLAVLAAGGLLRAFVAPGAPVHANGHGIAEVRVLVVDPPGAIADSGPYGRTFFAFMSPMVSLLGRSERSVYGVNGALGTLAVLGMFLLAKAVEFSDAGALLAALALALSPCQVWLSGTESQMAMHLCFLLFGLAGLLAALRAERPAWLWGGVALLAASATVHIITVMAFPAAVAFALLTAPRPPGGRLRRHLAAALLVAAAWLAYHAVFLAPAAVRNGAARLDPWRLLLASAGRDILFDPSLTSPLVPALAAWGFLAAWSQRRRLALAAAAAFLVLVPLSFTVDVCRTDALRFQAPTQWIVYLLAAFPFSGLTRRSWGRLGSAVVAAGLALTSAYGLALVGRGDEEVDEYRFMRKIARGLPAGSVVRLPAGSSDGSLQTDFPDYIGKHELARGPARVPGEDGLDLIGDRGLVYLGLDCYRSAGDEPLAAGRMRRACKDVCRDRLVPVEEAVLDADPGPWGYQKRFWELSSARPVVGLYRCEKASGPRRAKG